MPPQLYNFLQGVPGFDFLVNAWLIVKVLFILLDLVLLCFFVFAFYKGWQMRPPIEIRAAAAARAKAKPTLRKEMVKRRWKDIVDKTANGSVDTLRVGIIQADTLVNDVLTWLGIPGEHMADRLTTFDPQEVKSLDRLWKAHRLRNDLVHTTGFSVSAEEANQTIEDYKNFLEEIGAF